MRRSKQQEQYQQWISDLCPQAINSMRDLLGRTDTPVNARVTLIGMILDRTMGKAETPLRVTTDQDSISYAEEQLMAIAGEIGAELEGPDPAPEMTETEEETE